MRYLIASLVLVGSTFHAESADYLSHPPLRKPPPLSKRPRDQGTAFFVDAKQGKDNAQGTENAPWRTVQHAITRLQPGSTLYLRGGTYYEQVKLRLHGTPEKPITLRCYPGEQAILDGGFSTFFNAPETAWEPYPDGGKGEYRSRERFPNLRNVYGWFGDSMLGLQTYFHAKDLRATNELFEWKDWNRRQETDVEPVYCGPGLWYDPATGYIHVRLAHTHLPTVANYKGESDPRKLPLVVTPFRATSLTLDGASHVKVQDLIIRGGGYDTVVLDRCEHVEFDNVTIWCGSYGMRIRGTQHLRILHCGLYGSCAPWTFRGDTSLRSYPGRPHRDITRLNTHAILVPDAGREYSVYALPINDNWEIAHCEMTDAHDGPYLGGVSMRFHHNVVEDMQDDGVYLSPMYPRYSKENAEIHLYENHFKQCLTALAFGGPEKINSDQLWIYRNLIELREPVPTGRPSSRNPKGSFSTGNVMGDHGSPPWSRMNIYHNTFIIAGRARQSDMGTLNATSVERPRFLLNNVFVHEEGLPNLRAIPVEHGRSDGNLYWQPKMDESKAKTWFQRYRSSPAFEESKKIHPPGMTMHSLVADPFLKSFRLQPQSPAIHAGVTIPQEWPDPLRAQDQGKPDLGALPLGAKVVAPGQH